MQLIFILLPIIIRIGKKIFLFYSKIVLLQIQPTSLNWKILTSDVSRCRLGDQFLRLSVLEIIGITKELTFSREKVIPLLLHLTAWFVSLKKKAASEMWLSFVITMDLKPFT